jgi:dUTP pyrophosphatase
MRIKFIKLDPLAQVPEYAHLGDSGADLRSIECVVIPVGERRLIKTGIAIDLGIDCPFGLEAQVRSRSGLAIRWGISVLNSPGTVDSGYTGEICVILINHGNADYLVDVGDKIAQLVVAPVLRIEFIEADALGDSDRGANGFGSTGS